MFQLNVEEFRTEIWKVSALFVANLSPKNGGDNLIHYLGSL